MSRTAVDPQTPAEFDAAFGFPRGTVAGWVRSGVLPAPPTEHAVVVAYLLRPTYGGNDLTVTRYAHERDAIAAQHGAAVRASLALAPEVLCPSPATADPASSADALPAAAGASSAC